MGNVSKKEKFGYGLVKGLWAAIIGIGIIGIVDGTNQLLTWKEDIDERDI